MRNKFVNGMAAICIVLVLSALAFGGGSMLQLDANTRLGNLERAVFGALQASTSIPTSGIQWQSQMTELTMTATQVDTMYTTPVAVLAAPGAGYGVRVEGVVFIPQAGSTVFSSGGAVTLVYTGGSVNPAASTMAASVMTNLAANASANSALGPTTTTLAIPSNTGVSITNATGVFVGNGTMKVKLLWRRFPL